MNSNPEAELLARCRKGEAEAWDELFDKHYAAAGRFIFQLAPDFNQKFGAATAAASATAGCETSADSTSNGPIR